VIACRARATSGPPRDQRADEAGAPTVRRFKRRGWLSRASNYDGGALERFRFFDQAAEFALVVLENEILADADARPTK